MFIALSLIVVLVLLAAAQPAAGRRAGRANGGAHGAQQQVVNPANGSVMFDDVLDINGHIYGQS